MFAPVSALIPRETSIIDVKTLRELRKPHESPQLTLRTDSGRQFELPRTIVCALAAELLLPMRDKPTDVFDVTDVLDFPGARNRFKAPLNQTLAEADKTMWQLLLRGKVAYLFDRYVTNQEITSMLLCIPDSNMEAIDLPGLVENWITLTHGATPEERRRAECILFFVLTKFDKAFVRCCRFRREPVRTLRATLDGIVRKVRPDVGELAAAMDTAQTVQELLLVAEPDLLR